MTLWYLPRVSAWTRVRSVDETRGEGERKQAERRRRATYGYLYAGHGACQAREGAAESGTPRGPNRARADPSFSMLDRVFACTRPPQILWTRTLSLAVAASRFNVYQLG